MIQSPNLFCERNPAQVAIYHYTYTPGDSTICCSFLPARAFLTYVDEVDWTVDKRKEKSTSYFLILHLLFRWYAYCYALLWRSQSASLSLHGMLCCTCYVIYCIMQMTTHFLKCLASLDILYSVPKRSDTRQPPLCGIHSSILAHKSSSPSPRPPLPCPGS